MLAFECIPGRKVGHRPVGGTRHAILARNPGVELEGDEVEIVLGEEVRDARKRQAMLLHVEQQVAAFAGAEEIARRATFRNAAPRLVRDEVLPAAADVVGGSADSRAPR